MTTQPNLLDPVVFEQTLAEAEKLGPAHVAAVKAQYARQVEKNKP